MFWWVQIFVISNSREVVLIGLMYKNEHLQKMLLRLIHKTISHAILYELSHKAAIKIAPRLKYFSFWKGKMRKPIKFI